MKDTLWGPTDDPGRNRRMQAAWRRSSSARPVALLCFCLATEPLGLGTASPLTETQLTRKKVY